MNKDPMGDVGPLHNTKPPGTSEPPRLFKALYTMWENFTVGILNGLMYGANFSTNVIRSLPIGVMIWIVAPLFGRELELLHAIVFSTLADILVEIIQTVVVQKTVTHTHYHHPPE